MADSEDKDRNLQEINNEIVQAMQHWKMTAAQKDSEKLQLLKENNDLRYQLSSFRNAQRSRARKLNAEMQAGSEEVLNCLVKASSEIARMLELTKSNMQDYVDDKPSRWSSLSSTPTTEKVNRVPPMSIDGRHIQPVVSLSRTLQPHNSGSTNSLSPNQNSVREPSRAVPIHMLQDLFIPLTRIDAERTVSNGEANVEQNVDEDSTEALPSDNSEQMEQSPSVREDFEEPNELLEPVLEEDVVETERDGHSRSSENPLEGPSWLLDTSSLVTMRRYQNSKRSWQNSASESHENGTSPGPSRRELQMESQPVSVTVACEFTPTVRRRRRAAPRVATPPPRRSPHRSPPPARRVSNSGRILKVMVAKMRLSDDDDDSNDDMTSKRSKYIANNKPAKRQVPDEIGQTEIPQKRPNLDEMQPKPQKISQRRFPDTPKHRESSPTKRHSTDRSPVCQLRDLNSSQRFMLFDTPSPKGSTDARVIVLESRNDEPEPCCSGVARSRTLSRGSSCDIHSNHNRSNHGNHNNSNHDNNLTNRHNNSNEDNRRRKNDRDTPTSQPSDNSNHGNHNNSNHGNHNNSNHGNNLTNRHNNSNEDNRRRKNDRDTPTSQPSDNSNHGNNNSSNHGNNLTNRHNHSNEDNRHRKNDRDTPTNQLSDNGNHGNHNNSNQDNLANRYDHSNEDNRRQKNNRDTPASELSDNSNNSNSNHGNNDSRNHTTSNRLNINFELANSRRLKKNQSDGRNDNGINSDSSSNSDLISEGRTRRPRKAVIYKEKPLNRKLRR